MTIDPMYCPHGVHLLTANCAECFIPLPEPLSSNPRLDGRTHWEDCWRDHLDCAVAKVERLTRELSGPRRLASA